MAQSNSVDNLNVLAQLPQEVFSGSKGISNYNNDTFNSKEATDVLAIPDYVFMSDSYTGQGGYLNGRYLVPHARESDYNRRRQLGYYRNFLAPIIRAKVDPIFSECFSRMAERDGEKMEDALFNQFVDNCDNAGTCLNDFMHKLTLDAVLQGVSFCVVDNFTEQPDTKQEAEDVRAMPYVYMKTKGDVVDYKLDQYGNIEMIIFKDKPVTVKNERGNDKLEDRFRQWTDMDSTVMKWDGKAKKYVPIETPVVHDLGEVPVYPIFGAKRNNVTELLVSSDMWDIAKCNWTIYNIDSELRESVRNQGFSIFYYQGAGDAMLTLGTANAMGLPDTTHITPGFASPDVNIPKMLMEYAEGVRESMFAMAEQSGVTGVKKQLSGEAKAWDFQAQGEVLKALTKVCHATEKWIADIFKLYTGEDFEYVADYQEDYQPRAVKDNIDLFQTILDNNISPKTNALAKKRMVHEAFGDEDADVIADIDEEIDAQADTVVRATADEAVKEMEAEMAAQDAEEKPVKPIEQAKIAAVAK